MSTVRIGTRGSVLALTQTGTVARDVARLAGLDAEDVELVRIRTEGDRLKGSLAALGGAGVFVAALREAVLDGRCDLAVHSLKDLPTAPASGLLIAAIPERADPRDALCARDGLTLTTLPPGARVGTGSPRRAAQIRAVRPDLDVVDIRGNVDTRLGRVPGLGEGPGDLDAVVLAAAGLSRIGRLDMASELLDPALVAPAPGQGALAVETRADGGPVPGALVALDHLPTRLAVTAERAVLNRLEAGCAAPVGTLARVEPAAPTAPPARAPRAAATGDLSRGELVTHSATNPPQPPGSVGADPGREGFVTDDVTNPQQHTGETLVLDAVVCATDGSVRLRASEWIPVPADRAEALAAAEALGVRIAERLLADGAAELAPLGQSSGVAASVPRTTAPVPRDRARTASGAAEPTPGTTTPGAAEPAPGTTTSAAAEPAPGTTTPAAAEPAPSPTTPEVTPGALAGPNALTGWRVLVPRGGDWGDRVGRLLREHGAQPTIVPLIEFVPPSDPDAVDAALAAVGRGDYAWVTVTSPRTVDFLAQSAARLPGLLDSATVGSATSTDSATTTDAITAGTTAEVTDTAADAITTPQHTTDPERSTGRPERPTDRAPDAADADAHRALAGLLARTRVAAVGHQTADALARVGVEADLLPSGEHSARGLVADFPHPRSRTDADPAPDPAAPDLTAPGSAPPTLAAPDPTPPITAAPDRPATPTAHRVLVPHSDLADATLADGLRALGWEVDAVVAYRTIPGPTPAPGLRDDVRSGAFDAVLLTSGSTAANLVDLLGTPASSTVVCCLGPHTARDARDRGLGVSVVAEDASAAGMVEALVRHAVSTAEPWAARARPGHTAPDAREERR